MTRESSTNSRGHVGTQRCAVLGSIVRLGFRAPRSNQRIVTQPRLRVVRIAHSQGLKAYPGGLGAVVDPWACGPWACRPWACKSRAMSQCLQQDVGRND
jgi:hypothetical protein